MFVINNEYWDVMVVAPDDESLWMPWGGYALGACNDGDKTIYISAALNEYDFWTVLAHEITHAQLYSNNIYLDYNTEEIVAEIVSVFGKKVVALTDEMFRRLITRGRF